jgi:glycosyltransferase involved in cell wall biosynthesis
LRNGFIREPSVAVEIESYRPSFILGEVAAPGQYPYVPNMIAESAVAIAGGFSPRAKGDSVTLTHTDASGTGRFVMSPGTPIGPGRFRRRTLVLIMPVIEGQPLRILHAVRAPVGGIIRHILDLANGQADRGHHVGIIADSLTGGERAEQALAEIAPRLKLGVYRFAIRREPVPADVLVWAHFMRLIRRLKPDVLHGHGAKAGVFTRLKTAPKDAIRVYTPHGGSLHYPLTTMKGAFYSRLERALMNSTDLFLFESAFARDTYQRTIGTPKGLVRTVFNGVTADEFDPIVKADDATDIVYVGEFRHIKGADLLVDAVARLRAGGKPVTLTLAGDGEESENLKVQVARLGLGDAVRFIGHVKARYGFSKGSLLVVPSRGDSMPYVVIEAAAAGIPMVAANVGGIPEIFSPQHADALFATNIVGAMADAIEIALGDPEAAQARAKALRERIFLHFSQKAMVDGVLAGYHDAFADR